MALPPLAAVSDLAAWVGQAIQPDDPRAGAVLSAASSVVRSYAGQSWTEPGATIPDVVSAVVVQVAARAWTNPDGLTSVTIDDGTRRWESGGSGLRLTDSERDLLSEYASGATSGLAVLPTTRGEGRTGAVYVPTGPPPSGPPFPWYSAEGLP